MLNQNHATVADFVKELDAERRATGNKKWIFASCTVAGRKVELKTYGHTYLQIYRVDGRNQELPPMDCKVATWKAAINQPFI